MPFNRVLYKPLERMPKLVLWKIMHAKYLLIILKLSFLSLLRLLLFTIQRLTVFIHFMGITKLYFVKGCDMGIIIVYILVDFSISHCISN